MLLSLSFIMLSGLFLGWLCSVVRMPRLFGMIIAGILIGPHVLGLISPEILSISIDLRKIALIIILIRAGLNLDLDDLKKVGRPAILMCFVPAGCEILGMVLLAPRILGTDLLDAAIMGAVVAAVSPAVVVPRMIRLIEEGYGTEQGIPQMILGGASVDDVFVIVMFTTFTGLAKGGDVSAKAFVNVPVSILTGIAAGLLAGFALWYFFDRCHMRDSIKVVILMSAAFIFCFLEDSFSATVPFASLIAVMGLGIAIRRKKPVLSARLSAKFDRLWVCAEIFLFVLVGASVEIKSAFSAGPAILVLLAGVLVFRMFGVWLCVLGTGLSRKEKLFCMLAYIPKATVQAAIGGIPLAMGLACGNIVLTVSVIAILVTAPLGAFAIDLTYRKWLRAEN